MPTFQITTHERWDHVVEYSVNAPTLETAVRMAVTGKVTYTSAEYQEGNPVQEVLSILEVINHENKEVINNEKKLKRLLDNSVG